MAADSIPRTESVDTNGPWKFQLTVAVRTVRKSKIPVLSTAPCRVILSSVLEALVENAFDLIIGLPDLPKVSNAACFDIILIPPKTHFIADE
tara:strand:+ start:32 stop:307 length:276 start_codon:yes stop_codon:yes gene_type:complete